MKSVGPVGVLLAWAESLRFPWLLAVTAVAFVVDLFVPDLVPFADVLFPFDPALRSLDEAALAEVEVTRREGGPRIEERYELHPSGAVTLRITDLDSGFSREYGLAGRG